jgi:hypothetical protein
MRRIGLSLFLISISFNAAAALIDNGSFTTDTTQALDWLDLSATVQMSSAGALAANPGWRLASNAEVESIFWRSFDGYYDSIGDQSDSDYGSYADQTVDAVNFQSLFGLTYQNGLEHHSYGLYKDEEDIWRLMGAYVEPDKDIVYGLNGNQDYWRTDDRGYVARGIYLVRATVVPIPAAFYLFASGLGLLGWFRRRKA